MRRRRRYGSRRSRPAGYRSAYSAGGAIKIRRSVNVANIQGSDTYSPYIPLTAIPGVNYYTLGNVINASDFKNLFNEYQISGVKISFNLRRLQNDSVTSAQSTIPTLYFSIDNDGNQIIPANLNEMLEKSTLQRRVLHPGKPVTVWIRPRVSALVYQSVIASAYSTAKGPEWLSTAQPDAMHYGLTWAVDEHRNTGNYIDIVTTYYMRFRGAQ